MEVIWFIIIYVILSDFNFTPKQGYITTAATTLPGIYKWIIFDNILMIFDREIKKLKNFLKKIQKKYFSSYDVI